MAISEPQKFQITFECTRSIAEPLSNFLSDVALSVSLIDAEDTPIFEPALNETPLWPTVKVIALFADEKSATETINLLEQFFPKLPAYTLEKIIERDWVSETQNQFQPMRIGNKLWIYPAWENIPVEHQPALRLAPGLAFGTGNHPTTKMCLEALAKFVTDTSTVIDFGCGSGILGLAALQLGAEKIYSVDIDPQALEATQQNFSSNAFADEKIFIGFPENLPQIKADIIVANILAKPLMELKNVFRDHLKDNGKIILAGLLASQAEEIIFHYRDWKILTLFMQEEEWVCLVG